MEDKSALVLYSIGIVTEDKPDGTDIILVSPIEKLNIQESGLINEKVRDYKNVDLPDMNGVVKEAEIKGVNKIKAKWIPFGHSNRISAPDVVAGETVILFKYQDVDEYFWTTIFREPSLRRLEKVLYAFSNLREKGESFDKDTSYWVEVDTKNKIVKFYTAKNDGEVVSYTTEYDTGSGTFKIFDDVGNSIEINSVQNSISITAEDIYLNGNVHIGGSANVAKSLKTETLLANGISEFFGQINPFGGINMPGL